MPEDQPFQSGVQCGTKAADGPEATEEWQINSMMSGKMINLSLWNKNNEEEALTW